MIKIPAMEELVIEVKDGALVLTQNGSYRNASIKIPLPTAEYVFEQVRYVLDFEGMQREAPARLTNDD